MITAHQEERTRSSHSSTIHTYSQAIQGQVHHQHTPPPALLHPSAATSMLPLQHHPMEGHPQHIRHDSMHAIHSHSPSPPAAISNQSHARNSSALYSHEMATPPFHFHHHHHHPAVYNGSYQGEALMHQLEHSTPPLPRPIHAHPAPPPPPSVLPPLLPPLLPQFALPYLPQNQHRERGMNGRPHQQEGLHIGQSSSSMKYDDGSLRERHFSGQEMHHVPASSRQQSLLPLYPTIYGGNVVTQDHKPTFPGYDSHQTSSSQSQSQVIQAMPHTSHYYPIQHSAGPLHASNESGSSTIYTAPRHPERYTDRNGASPSAGQSPTYQRRASVLRHPENMKHETSKKDLSSSSPSRIIPDQHRTPTRQLKRNHHHHHHVNAGSPSKMGSPFISGEQHNLTPGKRGNNPSRNQHHRRASIASTTTSYYAARMDSSKASNAVMNDPSYLGRNEDHRPSSPNPPPLVEPSEAAHFPVSTHPYPSIAAGAGGLTDPQQPFLQYQPCVNPGCPNIYHYTQQTYQPTPIPAPAHSDPPRYDSTRSAMTTTFKLVEVPGMIQPPAWCEVSPCGCALCRDCFSFTVTICEIVPPDISQGQFEAIKLFKCIICDAPVREFGPINVEVQDVVESEKALFGGPTAEYDFHHEYTLYENSFAQDDGETTFTDIEDSGKHAIQAPRIIFGGFQSAQDIASGAHSHTISSIDLPSSHTTKSEAGSSTSIATSPLLQSPSKSGIRYARSDPPPSIPSLSPLMMPKGEGELVDTTTDLTAPSEWKIVPISDALAAIMSDHFQAGASSAEDIASLAKDAALVYPTLSRIETTTVPPRKVSTTSTVTTSHDSPVSQTPDLGTWSSSSASTTALNSPEALHSPTVPLKSEGQAPWRQKALPAFYETKDAKTEDQRDDAQDRERQAKLVEDFKRLSVHAKKDESDSGTVDLQSVGLGLTFGTVTPGKPVKTRAPNSASRNDSGATTEESLHIATPLCTPARPPETPKAQALLSASSVRNAPNRVLATPSSTRNPKADSTSPTSHIKSRAAPNVQGEMSPSKGSRGRGRGGIHRQSTSHLRQDNHAHKPSSSTVSYNSARSRTDTQSSVQTASSSISGSSSSHGGLFSPNHRPHNRKVSMAENKSPRLPDLINNPSDEMLRIWEDNKARWWKDPWNGKLMGVKQKIIGVEKSMVKTDGSPLIRGRGAGISWPILKVHNIHFRTTIADIETFVPPGVLAPLEHNAQGIHILCNATDGKTRPYAYVECISTAAAEHLMAVSDGEYLAGRQVAFRPVTQKDLALDLFQHVRRGGYYKSTILDEDPPSSKGSSHQRRHSFYERAGDLELFTEEDDRQLRRLFHHALPDTLTNSEAIVGTGPMKAEVDTGMYFSFPIERPFARLASMIVKYPSHVLIGAARASETQMKTVDRLFECLLFAMDRLAPHTGKDTSLYAVLYRLYCAALQCPAFDDRRPALAEKWAFLTAQGSLVGPDPQSSSS